MRLKCPINFVYVRIVSAFLCNFDFSEARNDLTICRMTECSASVAGGKEILLFCEKVTKDDIQVTIVWALIFIIKIWTLSYF
jgi:hypothetical protein